MTGSERGRLALALLAFVGCGSPTPAPAYRDLAGVTRRPLDVRHAQANVLIFTTVDCPIANGYAPAIGTLVHEYEPRGFRFFLVHVDPDVDEARARSHARDYDYTLPVLLDLEHELVELAGVTVTPEVAVLTPDGTLAYRGRIDDGYAALGKKRVRPTTHDLRDALEALAADRPVPVPRTPAVGCLIPD